MANVLLVDDAAFTLQRHEKIFSALGHKVKTTGKAKEAAAILGSESFDLAVVDLLMPEQDGMETLKEIRSKYPTVKVVIVSADIQEDRKKEAFSLGAADFINKPLDTDKARTTLARLGY